MYKRITLAALLILSSLLSGCSFHIFRPTIEQGNQICDQSVAQLHPGMNTEQVLYLMGTPMLASTFQPDRWDYVYTFKKPPNPRWQRHFTLFFSCDGILQSIQASPWMIVK